MKFKKYLGIILAGAITVAMVGCSSEEKNDSEKSITNQESSVKKDIPEGIKEEVGDGTIIISTPGGTSENDNTPVLFAEKDLLMTQIGLDAEGFDGSKISYIYIDGMLNSKEQLGDMSQITLTLESDALNEGVHDVEVVQFDNDETTGNHITYKKESYEVKMK